jgi:hypothetical protein
LSSALFLRLQLLSSATYYFATSGNDRNPGTQEQPFGSLRKAGCVLKPEATLFIRGGEYGAGSELTDGSENSIIPSGASWDNPVTIKAYPGETPIFRTYFRPGGGADEATFRQSFKFRPEDGGWDSLTTPLGSWLKPVVLLCG